MLKKKKNGLSSICSRYWEYKTIEHCNIFPTTEVFVLRAKEWHDMSYRNSRNIIKQLILFKLL